MSSGEGFIGLIGGLVIAAVIGFGVLTPSAPLPAGTTQSSYGPIAELGSHLLGGVGKALDNPDQYAAANPGR